MSEYTNSTRCVSVRFMLGNGETITALIDETVTAAQSLLPMCRGNLNDIRVIFQGRQIALGTKWSDVGNIEPNSLIHVHSVNSSTHIVSPASASSTTSVESNESHDITNIHSEYQNEASNSAPSNILRERRGPTVVSLASVTSSAVPNASRSSFASPPSSFSSSSSSSSPSTASSASPFAMFLSCFPPLPDGMSLATILLFTVLIFCLGTLWSLVFLYSELFTLPAIMCLVSLTTIYVLGVMITFG